MLTITNTTKAHIIAAVNAVLGALAAFKVGHLTAAQTGALLVAVNAVLSAFVGVTYKSSSKRVQASPPPPPPPSS